jgi:ADP-ribose pyrophosphatase YjhB (NUDIX family)
MTRTPVPIHHCNACGARVEYRIPDGDTHSRAVCPACGHIQYQNPKVVVGCAPVWEDRILLCRRAIEPRLGFWTIPAGFMENGETTQDAARREAAEEALAAVEVGSLLAVVHVLHANQVHVMFRARLPEPQFGVGHESLEVRLCDEAEIPWQDIAFRSVDFALRRYLDDRRLGVDQHHFTSIDLRARAAR